MGNKVFHKIIVLTKEQEVIIMPTEMFNGIIIECKEMDGTTASPRMYLNNDEMELLIEKMRQMMGYIKQ